MRGDVALAAERLYRAALLDSAKDPAVDVAIRDAQARRDLEMLVIRSLQEHPDRSAEIAEPILAGALEASGKAPHKKAVDRFRSGKEPALPPTLTQFLDYAGRPSRWGDWLAAATIPPHDEGGLARILVQLELGDPTGEQLIVEIDPGFGAGAENDKALEGSVRNAVAAALSYLRDRPVSIGDDIDRVSLVRLFRGGLPWPFASDGDVPTEFEKDMARTVQTGPSVGLAVALATVRAFMPVWTTRWGPPSVATGDVRETGSIELVGGIGDKAEAAMKAELPFIVPGGSLATGDARTGTSILPAPDLGTAVIHAFNLVDGHFDDLLKSRPKQLFGRKRELRTILSAWDPDRLGEPTLVLIQGESGIGKTGLLTTALATLIADQVPILFVDALDHSPFEAFVTRLVRAISPTDLRDHVSQHGQWLSTVAADLWKIHPIFEKRPDGHQEPGQAKQATAVADLVTRGARTQGHLTLVIDNLQGAKEEDWRILQELLNPLRHVPAKVLATFREVNDSTRVAVSEPTFGYLRARRRIVDIDLEPLKAVDVAEWLASLDAVLGNLGESACNDLLHATGGGTWELSLLSDEISGMLRKPSFDLGQVLVAARRIGRDMGIEVDELGDIDEQPFFDTLSRASVSRTLEFEVQLLAAAREQGYSELSDHLAKARASNIVTRSESALSRWRFRHEKIRKRFFDRLDRETRAHCHLAMGEALERLADESGQPPPIADLAHHYMGALPYGPVEKAVHYKSMEAEDATRRLAYEEARDLRVQAVTLLKGSTYRPVQLLAEAGLGAAMAHSHLGLELEAQPYYLEAIEMATMAGDLELVETATLGFAGPPEDRGRFDQDLVRLLKEAARADDWMEATSPNRTRLFGRLLFERVLAARRQPELYPMPPVEDLLDQARAMHNQLGVAHALNARLLGAWPSSDTAQLRIDLADEMLAAAAETGEKDLEIWGYAWKAIHQLEMGKRDEAERSIAMLGERAKTLHHGYARWGHAVLQPMLAHLSGRIEESIALAETAYSLRSEAPTSMLWCGIQRMLGLREFGRIAEIEPMMGLLRYTVTADQAPDYDYDNSLADSGWALLCCELERFDEARVVIQPLAAKGFQGMLRDPAWPTSATLLAEACAALGEKAPALYDILLPRAGEVIVVIMGVACLGAADRYLGLLAATGENWDVAEGHFREALRMNEMIDSPLWTAHTQCDYATMLLKRGRAEDRSLAEELNSAAAKTAGDLDLVSLAGRAARVAGEIEHSK